MSSYEDITSEPLPQLPPRRPDSHKGDYGRALLVGGSRGMSGAISLAGRATLRSGAGLVTVAVPNAVQSMVAIFEPSYMTRGLPDDGSRFLTIAVDEIAELAATATAVALGPGLGRSGDVSQLVERLYRDIERPMVVDADALNALAERPELPSQAAGPRVLTPHPGEFARLTGRPYVESERLEAAIGFAARLAAETSVTAAHDRKFVLVLKGHRTIVTDGLRVSVNRTGNPGMATGGAGDVLAGILTGLLCQGLPPFDAARLGVHVHGLAGDLAAKRIGQVSLIATDLIDYLPQAFQHTSHPTMS